MAFRITATASIDAFERDLIRERVKAGLKTAKIKGKKLGRPTSRVDLHKARLLRTQGHSMRQIAEILKIPKSTLSRAMSQKPHENVA